MTREVKEQNREVNKQTKDYDAQRCNHLKISRRQLSHPSHFRWFTKWMLMFPLDLYSFMIQIEYKIEPWILSIVAMIYCFAVYIHHDIDCFLLLLLFMQETPFRIILLNSMSPIEMNLIQYEIIKMNMKWIFRSD